MEWLRKILEETEVKDGKIDVDGIMKKAEAEFSKNAVSKKDFGILEEKLSQAEKDIKNRDKQLEELKKIDVDKLKSEIEKLQEENKENKKKGETEIRQMRISHAVEMALIKAGVKGDKAMAAVKALLNLESAELDGDSIKGLDKQIEELKADDTVGGLFSSDKEIKLTGIKPGESGDGIPIGKDIDKMNYEELCAYMEANPGAQI